MPAVDFSLAMHREPLKLNENCILDSDLSFFSFSLSLLSFLSSSLSLVVASLHPPAIYSALLLSFPPLPDPPSLPQLRVVQSRAVALVFTTFQFVPNKALSQSHLH